MKNILNLEALDSVVGGADGCYYSGELRFGIQIGIGKCELK